MKNKIIFTWLLLDAVIVYGFSEIRKCNTQDFEQNCPQSAKCVETLPTTHDGLCHCKNETLFTFNPKFTNDNDYCIYINKQPNITDKQHTNEVKMTSTENGSKSNSNATVNQVKPLSGAHHIVAGILIPLIVVLTAIGGVAIYKKLHITQRIRNIRRTRRNRPFYEDVMLGNNDNDDPPLI